MLKLGLDGSRDGETFAPNNDCSVTGGQKIGCIDLFSVGHFSHLYVFFCYGFLWT